MKNNEELQKEDHYEAKRPILSPEETWTNSKVARHMKKFFYIAGLTGIGFFLNSCAAGYVGNEPSYVEYARPAQPSNLHVWINGDWGWNNRSHMYVQRAGYWDMPRQGRTYVSGSWQTSPRGRYWSKGHWQRQDQRGNMRQDNRGNQRQDYRENRRGR